MPWELILAGGAIVLLVAAALRQVRRPRPITDPFPDIGQPPRDAEPIMKPRLQDIGFGSYELPLPGPEEEMDRGPG